MVYYEVIVVGGGFAGIIVVVMFCNLVNFFVVIIIDFSEKYYYQLIWMLVGVGVFFKEVFECLEVDYILFGVSWVKDFVVFFDFDNNGFILSSGESYIYDVLVVIVGI